MLKYFDGYVNFGLKPIAMYLHSKKPVSDKWNEDWTPERWRGYFESNEQKYNMGILLGNVIDVEADDEESNKLLDSLLGDTPHPLYSSARSVHHLFLTPDPTLTFQKIQGIEFRGNRVCSALPPSIHESGVKYRFLKTSEFVLNPLPDDLLDFYWENKKKEEPPKFVPKKPEVKPGHKRTICKICGQRKFIHKKRLILEVKAFAKYNLCWMCHTCRELRGMDMRDDCREVRKDLKKVKYRY
jgi:hypothetical protein